MKHTEWVDGDTVILTGNGLILFRQCGRWTRHDGGLVFDDVIDRGTHQGWAIQIVNARNAVKTHVPDKKRRPRMGTHGYRKTPRDLRKWA